MVSRHTETLGVILPWERTCTAVPSICLHSARLTTHFHKLALEQLKQFFYLVIQPGLIEVRFDSQHIILMIYIALFSTQGFFCFENTFQVVVVTCNRGLEACNVTCNDHKTSCAFVQCRLERERGFRQLTIVSEFLVKLCHQQSSFARKSIIQFSRVQDFLNLIILRIILIHLQKLVLKYSHFVLFPKQKSGLNKAKTPI